MAHHQSLPASYIPKVITMLVAPAGFGMSTTMVSLVELSSLKFGLLESDSHKSTVIGSAPSKETLMVPV